MGPGNRGVGDRGNNRVGDGNLANNRPNNVGRSPAYNNWRGPYGDNHRGWMNGYWHGYHNNPGWNWGYGTGVPAWGYGSPYYGWGYSPYANPYYGGGTGGVGGVGQPVAGVASQAPAYDYSQPINTQTPLPADDVTKPALTKFDAAREAFKSGDYPSALKLTDEGLKALPNDATLHEFRALTLFALGQYDQAAQPLYAVLSIGPGWDWTTMAGLYPSVDVYTEQLRALEGYLRKNPRSSGAHFVLAYHYLTQGNNDAAVAQLKDVQKLTPSDTLSAQLIKALSPASEAPETVPSPSTGKEGKLAGTWKAAPAKQTSIKLNLQDDGTFTWKANVNGKPQDIAGKWSATGGILTLADEAKGGALVGNVAWQDESQFNFRALGAPGDDPGLNFSR